MKQKILWLFQASKGSQTRGRILRAIKDSPRNTLNLKNMLNLNYKTVRHHLKIMEDNKIITSEGEKYGKVYFISDEMKKNYGFFEKINKDKAKKSKLGPSEVIGGLPKIMRRNFKAMSKEDRKSALKMLRSELDKLENEFT